ncbi:hypothetical protein DRQ33_04695 [bacterium]|nr:MAG: hypothetical protein DRQ33_04695 [bacterium]
MEVLIYHNIMRTSVIITLIFAFTLLGNCIYAEQISPQKVIETMSKKWEMVQDCTCILQSYIRLGKQKQNRTMNYYFMKPKWIKLRIIDGKHDGTRLIYNPYTNRVEVKTAGVLGLFTFTLSPDNSRVQSIRGHRIDNNHIGYIIQRWQEYLQNCDIYISETDSTIILNASETDSLKYYGTYYEKLVIDKNTYFPLYFEQFDISNTLINKLIISNVKINVGLNVNDFKFN